MLEYTKEFIPDFNKNQLLTIKGEHWMIRAVKLHAFTDDYDTLTEENEYNLYRMNIAPCTGEIFYLENPVDGSGIVIISHTPDHQTTTLTIQDGVVGIENGENGVSVLHCKAGECEEACRDYLRGIHKNKSLVAMSNTWGDCNRFDRVCQDFVLKEMDAAEEIGIDIVQIDDGWQKGNTDDMSLRDEQNRRIFKGDFWEIDTERFPKGMKYVADYGAKKGLKTGMWFAPDSHDDFALLDRDVSVLKKAYDEWGIRFFKLDMYWIMTNAERNRFLKLLESIYSFGDDVDVQLDATRNLRINYLCGHQYGTVFVENRYAKWNSAYPHRVLRNLWMISKYIPSSKFQFELINPDLYKECYEADDPLAPSLYDMDYMFATVMLSNPLFWMEMQFLSEDRRKQLKSIMEVWKENREKLAKCDVMPIGEKPSGKSFSGFYISNGKKPEYLLLFREALAKENNIVKLPVESAQAEILASNTNADIKIENGLLYANLEKARSYVFLKLK